MKKCTRCFAIKPLTGYYAQKMNSKDGYQSHCKTCDNARVTLWRGKNLELVKKYSKKADANKYLNNKDQIDQRNKAWKQQNPDKLAAMDARRRASVLQRTPKWVSQKELLRIKCLYSLAAMLNKHGVEPWHVDHIIPLQGRNVSGLHVYSNLRVLPSSENLAKGNRYDIT